MGYHIEFERVGRTRGVIMGVTKTTPGEIAEEVHGLARRFLLSRHYEVQVDLDAGTVKIDGGRYGEGTIREVTPDVE